MILEERLAKILLDEDYKTEFKVVFIPTGIMSMELRGVVKRTHLKTNEETVYKESAMALVYRHEDKEITVMKAKERLLDYLLKNIDFDISQNEIKETHIDEN